MTPTQLRKALESLYGAELSRWQLCVHFAEDTGTHPDTVQKWFNEVNPTPKWVGLAIEALKAREG